MQERVSGSAGSNPPDANRSAIEGNSPPALRLVRAGEATAAPAMRATPDDVSLSADAADLSPALEDVVRRFGSFMRRTAHRHNLAATDIEDVVQETRIRLWKALGTSDRIRQAPASYIYRTATSAALDFLRRRRARRENSIDALPVVSSVSLTSHHDADEALRASEVNRAVVRAVDLLVESRRGVVRMYLAGYDREEIAELLGWSEAKTRNLLYRGLADVRASLVSWGYGPGGHE